MRRRRRTEGVLVRAETRARLELDLDFPCAGRWKEAESWSRRRSGDDEEGDTEEEIIRWQRRRIDDEGAGRREGKS